MYNFKAQYTVLFREDPSIPTKEQVLDNGVRIITRLGENTTGAKVPAQAATKIVWDLQIGKRMYF
jgi:hypothetical protein